MLKRCLVGLLAAASLCGVRAAATVNFDQGVDVKGVVSSVQDQMHIDGSPAMTYTLTTDPKVHAKGFIKKHIHHVDLKTYKDFGGVSIPDKLDLRSKVTQIEDQGQCGSCWAFSLTATHRDGHALGGKDSGRLSAEWLVDNSPESQGCNGGFFDSANDFIGPKGGQPLWKTCPYATGTGKCPKDAPLAAHITGWHMLGTSNGPSTQDIEAYMASSGKPVSITVGAGTGSWEYYHSGVYNGCKDGEEDHMINIVGWDNEGTSFDSNGNLPPGKGVWILRNSWGTSWGDGGFMRTKMTDAKGVRCNAVAKEASYFDFDD